MDRFTDLMTYASDSTLYNQEIDVILDVIDHALGCLTAYPTKGTFSLKGQPKGQEAQCAIQFNLAEGAHQSGEPKTIVLDTTYGCFLASFYAECDTDALADSVSTGVLASVACALAHMSEGDATLQSSTGQIRGLANTIFSENMVRITDALFDSCETPCLMAWREWHGTEEPEGWTLFFE